MKRIVGIAVGLFIGWIILQAIMKDPTGSANKVGDAANGAGAAGSSIGTFLTSLSGPALVILVIIGLAVYFGRKK